MKYNVSEIAEVIANRRTIKPEHFSEREVHKELIEKLLNAAKWAPTHGLTQPWRFKVFLKDGLPKLSAFIDQAYQAFSKADFNAKKRDKYLNRIARSSVVIMIGMERQESEKIPEIEEVLSVGCATQNICLLATAYGLGTYWSSPKFLYSDTAREFLGLNTKGKCLGLLFVGYPNSEWPKGQRKPVEYFSEWVNEEK